MSDGLFRKNYFFKKKENGEKENFVSAHAW